MSNTTSNIESDTSNNELSDNELSDNELSNNNFEIDSNIINNLKNNLIKPNSKSSVINSTEVKLNTTDIEQILTEYNSDDDIEDISDFYNNNKNKITTKYNKSSFLTKYEYTNCIITRAKEIEQGANLYISINNLKDIDYKTIAKKELEAGKLPYFIVRDDEYIPINELKIKN